MGQVASRPRDGNQVAVEAQAAFERNSTGGLLATRAAAPDTQAPCSGLVTVAPATSRSSLVKGAAATLSGSYGALIGAANPTGGESGELQQTSAGGGETPSGRAQRLASGPARVRRGGRRVCPRCAPVECAHCRHEAAPPRQVDLQQGSGDGGGGGQQCWAGCCASCALCQPLECAPPASQMSGRSGAAAPDEVTRATCKAGAIGRECARCNGPPADGRRARAALSLAHRLDNQLVTKGRERAHRLMDLASARANLSSELGQKRSGLTTPASRVSSASEASSTLSLVSSVSAGSSPALVIPHGTAVVATDATTATLATTAKSTTRTSATSLAAAAAAALAAQPDQLIRGAAAAANNLVCGPLSCELSRLIEPGERPTESVAERESRQPDSINALPTTSSSRGRSEKGIQTTSSEQQQGAGGGGQSAEKEQQQLRGGPRASGASETSRDYLVWNELALRYGRMASRKSSREAPAAGEGRAASPPYASCTSSRARRHPNGSGGGAGGSSNTSCLWHVLCALLQTLFPILGALKNYSLPGDLATDLAAGFTVAVLHIPQGMAYGLLSGVEPIYGLYVSFIPVLVLALMSKSRHVSYGTFAVISMLLVSTVDNVRASIDRDTLLAVPNVTSDAAGASSPRSLPLVITDNHQPAEVGRQQQHQRQFLLKDLARQSADELEPTRPLPAGVSASLFADSAGLLSGGPLDSAGLPELLANPPTSIEILACACLVCGAIHITMALMRLGVLSLMFSDQLVSSFTTASAIHVLTSQLAGLFDLSLAPIHDELFKIVRIWWQFGRALLFEHFNQTTALLSLASIAFLLLVKLAVEPALRRRHEKLTCLPSELALMAVVILCSWRFKFESHYNVKIIGHVPTGLPEARVPRLELVPYVLKDSLTIALISFAMNLSIARVYAKRFRYELDANQELFAVGTANIVSSFFSCFPCASSLSRSSVQSSLNVRSQLCALFSCAIVVLIICFFAHILHHLPRSTLSCIIVVALKGILMQLRDFYDNWRLSKLDALVWLVTFVAVIVFGVTYGLILGIVASLFMIFLRLLTPNHSILGRLPETDIYVDVEAFAECEEIQRVKIFRFNSALCYLNRTQLKTKIEQLLPSVYKPQGFGAICAQLHRRNSPHEPAHANVHFLVVDCSALSYCDYSGAATLVELIEDLEREKVTVYLAACPLKLIDMLEKMKSTGEILRENVFPTISVAVGQATYLLSSKQSASDLLNMSVKPPPAPMQQQQQQTIPCSGPTSELKESSIIDLP